MQSMIRHKQALGIRRRAEIERWLEQYRAFVEERRGARFADFEREFQRLAAELKPLY